MVNWKRFVGYSAYLGNRRELDEQLGKLREYEYAVAHNQRDAVDCARCIPLIEARIARLRVAIVKEDA